MRISICNFPAISNSIYIERQKYMYWYVWDSKNKFWIDWEEFALLSIRERKARGLVGHRREMLSSLSEEYKLYKKKNNIYTIRSKS